MKGCDSALCLQQGRALMKLLARSTCAGLLLLGFLTGAVERLDKCEDIREFVTSRLVFQKSQTNP